MENGKVVTFEKSEMDVRDACPDIIAAIKKRYSGGSPARYLDRWVAGDLALVFDDEDLMVIASHGIHYKVLN